MHSSSMYSEEFVLLNLNLIKIFNYFFLFVLLTDTNNNSNNSNNTNNNATNQQKQQMLSVQNSQQKPQPTLIDMSSFGGEFNDKKTQKLVRFNQIYIYINLFR